MTTSELDLILASASPRRRDLLEGIGVRFRVEPSSIPEEQMDGEFPQDQVRRLAVAKALEISRRFREHWVLGADTIVVIEGDILGKPSGESDARVMLARLAGKTHHVFTGYALVRGGSTGNDRVRYVKSAVRIRDLSPVEIAGYVATGEPLDKAGAYAIQGIGSGIVESVSGSYTNVVGLPICEVARDMQELGIFDFLHTEAAK